MKTGKDLIALGYKPGKNFKEALTHINANALNDDQICSFMDSITPVHIDPHAAPVSFYQNLRAEN